jgi:hypothetical protein
MAGTMLFVLFISCTVVGRTIFPSPLSPRIANYAISVTLDARAKMLDGKETLVWRNTSPDVITELRFHLYLNAFKNTASTFIRESGGVHRGFSQPKDTWGWIDISSMKIRGGEEMAQSIEFIHPDDDNVEDRTACRVPLRSPLRPGQTITLDIIFAARLPGISARTGYYNSFFMVGQWFPKIGVYESAGQRYATKGQWNCHQFHANTEFYADFGVYDVDITVPEEYVLGATGNLERITHANGAATHYYHAEDVHDFAWTASPRYHEVLDQWKHVKIRLLVQPEHKQHAARYLGAAKTTFAYLDDHVGPYPYPTLTIVDPPLKALGAGGMEYPTFITGGSVWGLGQQLLFTETATVHELGHNWWYGMIANNEFEEAWLDEGVNTYYEMRIMDDTYGARTSSLSFAGLEIGDGEQTRFSYVGMRNPGIAPIAQPAWQFSQGGYGSLTYYKTGTFLMTLEQLIGRAAMDSSIKTFFRKWQFKHPCERDFIAAFNEVVPRFHGDKFGKNLDWFFDQMLHSTGTCDYEVTSLKVTRMRPETGIFGEGTSKQTVDEAPDTTTERVYESSVVVSRLGQLRMPVEVLVRFRDGREVREEWDGVAPTKRFTYRKSSEAAWASIDPDRRLLIDTNRLNNSKGSEAPQSVVWKYAAKFLFWIQNLLHTMAFWG